jgi:plastocyanin
MFGNARTRSLEGIAVRRQPAQLNRREVLRLIGGFGLATAGMVALGRRASAHQEGAATPAATPQVGPQADGTTLWKVVVGGMDMENMIEYHGFFPGEITINAGDSIWFAEQMPMFHTITFPGPLLFTGAGGTVVDGSQLVSTGVDVFGDGSPWVFTFPKAGTYEYACIPHGAVMRAKVIVQDAGSALPKDQAAYDADAAAQIAALQEQGLAEIEKYSAPVSTKRDDGTTLWEVAVGAGGFSQVRVQRILPGSMEVTAGDTIKYIIQSEGEPHTVSFIGAGETPPEDTLVEAFADGSPKFVQNMETFLPQGGNVFSGKGWVNSGFMGIPQLGLPMEWEVTFDTPGEYVPFCRLHGDADGTGMAGKLTVKAAG